MNFYTWLVKHTKRDAIAEVVLRSLAFRDRRSPYNINAMIAKQLTLGLDHFDSWRLILPDGRVLKGSRFAYFKDAYQIRDFYVFAYAIDDEASVIYLGQFMYYRLGE